MISGMTYQDCYDVELADFQCQRCPEIEKILGEHTTNGGYIWSWRDVPVAKLRELEKVAPWLNYPW